MDGVGNVADEEAEGLVRDYSRTQACGWLRVHVHKTPSKKSVPLIVHANLGRGYVIEAAEAIAGVWSEAIAKYNREVLALL